MDYYDTAIIEVPGLFKVVPFVPFRSTPGVTFDNLPTGLVKRVNAIDRVMHAREAQSPGPVDDVERPWYMHPNQDDNLVVLAGVRHVELYRKLHGEIERFTVTPDEIVHRDTVVHRGGAMLVWPRGVFHRIRSGPEGSASLNFAVHYPGIDMRTNFNIYDLDVTTGEFTVVREGFLDQRSSTTS